MTLHVHMYTDFTYLTNPYSGVQICWDKVSFGVFLRHRALRMCLLEIVKVQECDLEQVKTVSVGSVHLPSSLCQFRARVWQVHIITFSFHVKLLFILPSIWILHP